ncbi:MAG TPA: YceI family protein [Caulobacteraceae bacterium]|jgi:polyisoprenoid-binding protein YceI
MQDAATLAFFAALTLGLAATAADSAPKAPARPQAQTRAQAKPQAPPQAQPPAGRYYMDRAHTSVSFQVSHLGFSHYTARFSRVDGTLQFDPAHPAAMRVEATIDPTSLEVNAPPAGFHDQLMGGNGWFEAAKFPQMTFRSTSVKLVRPHEALVTGALTLHGVTAPVTLDVTYNGGYAANSYDPGGARIGFSAHGSLKRSAFGVSAGIPAPGSSFGVGDQVDIAIETEFNQKRAGK